jgi:hypothetical protein
VPPRIVRRTAATLPALQKTAVSGQKLITNLVQDAELGSGWSAFEFIHPGRLAGDQKKFQPVFSKPRGRL